MSTTNLPPPSGSPATATNGDEQRARGDRPRLTEEQREQFGEAADACRVELPPPPRDDDNRSQDQQRDRQPDEERDATSNDA